MLLNITAYINIIACFNIIIYINVTNINITDYHTTLLNINIKLLLQFNITLLRGALRVYYVGLKFFKNLSFFGHCFILFFFLFGGRKRGRTGMRNCHVKPSVVPRFNDTSVQLCQALLLLDRMSKFYDCCSVGDAVLRSSSGFCYFRIAVRFLKQILEMFPSDLPDIILVFYLS